MAGKQRFTITNADAPKAGLLEKDPSDIHVADAEFINAQVGANVVTPKQVQVCKVLLMAAQAARREDAPAPAKATAKATTAKASTAKGRTAAAKAGPKGKAAAAKAGTAKGRQRAARGAQAAESTTAAEPSADAPF